MGLQVPEKQRKAASSTKLPEVHRPQERGEAGGTVRGEGGSCPRARARPDATAAPAPERPPCPGHPALPCANTFANPATQDLVLPAFPLAEEDGRAWGRSNPTASQNAEGSRLLPSPRAPQRARHRCHCSCFLGPTSPWPALPATWHRMTVDVSRSLCLRAFPPEDRLPCAPAAQDPEGSSCLGRPWETRWGQEPPNRDLLQPERRDSEHCG